MICEKDPLHDSGLKFALKLLKNDAKCKIYRFKNLPHGVLNMSFPQGLPEAYKYEERNIAIMKKYFTL